MSRGRLGMGASGEIGDEIGRPRGHLIASMRKACSPPRAPPPPLRGGLWCERASRPDEDRRRGIYFPVESVEQNELGAKRSCGGGARNRKTCARRSRHRGLSRRACSHCVLCPRSSQHPHFIWYILVVHVNQRLSRVSSHVTRLSMQVLQRPRVQRWRRARTAVGERGV